MPSFESLQKELKSLANPAKAKILQGFFKTGKGQYGEGDIFYGITVPQSRLLAKKYSGLSLENTENLLFSKIHEERLISLLILVDNFVKGDGTQKKQIFDFYLRHTKYINNWDLVDLSSHKIIGKYLLNRPKKALYKLAESKNIWDKRIAIISTYQFIRNNRFDDTLKIAQLLLHDKHDLIQKAVGWMLREVGKRSPDAEKKFLDENYKKMPHTALRYAIEKFPEKERLKYLSKKL